VIPGETGFLVPLAQDPVTLAPLRPEAFARALAERLREVLGDPALQQRLGRAGRARAEAMFSWRAVADQTVALYRALTGLPRHRSPALSAS
ncbi:MAG: glycosyltransferase, partial [Terriglobales bacterium]